MEPQRHGGTENHVNGLTTRVIGACIEIHKLLGPGLLESAYEECLCYELGQLGIRFTRQQPLPVTYKGVNLDCGNKMDIVVQGSLILELKTVEHLLPIHGAQLLTYFKLTGLHYGLLLNFNVPVFRQGIKRIANGSE